MKVLLPAEMYSAIRYGEMGLNARKVDGEGRNEWGRDRRAVLIKSLFFEIKVAIPFLLLAGSGICLFRDLWTRDGLVC